MKTCAKCLVDKSIDEFHNNRNMKDGRARMCKKCANENIRRYRATESGKCKQAVIAKRYAKTASGKRSRKSARYKCLYGITLRQHKLMYADQNGCCALCSILVSYGDMKTDHNHVTDKVRGLLCNKCNAGLGMLGDNIEGLQAALKYLRDEE